MEPAVARVLDRFEVRLRELEGNKLDTLAASEKCRDRDVKAAHTRHKKRVKIIESVYAKNAAHIQAQREYFQKQMPLVPLSLSLAPTPSDPAETYPSRPVTPEFALDEHDSGFSPPRPVASASASAQTNAEQLCKIWGKMSDNQKLVWNKAKPYLDVQGLLVESASVCREPGDEECSLRINFVLVDTGLLPNIGNLTAHLVVTFEDDGIYQFKVTTEVVWMFTPRWKQQHRMQYFGALDYIPGDQDPRKQAALSCCLRGVPKLSKITRIEALIKPSARWIEVNIGGKEGKGPKTGLWRPWKLGIAVKLRNPIHQSFEVGHDEKMRLQLWSSYNHIVSEPLPSFHARFSQKLDGIEISCEMGERRFLYLTREDHSKSLKGEPILNMGCLRECAGIYPGLSGDWDTHLHKKVERRCCWQDKCRVWDILPAEGIATMEKLTKYTFGITLVSDDWKQSSEGEFTVKRDLVTLPVWRLLARGDNYLFAQFGDPLSPQTLIHVLQVTNSNSNSNSTLQTPRGETKDKSKEGTKETKENKVVSLCQVELLTLKAPVQIEIISPELWLALGAGSKTFTLVNFRGEILARASVPGMPFPVKMQAIAQRKPRLLKESGETETETVLIIYHEHEQQPTRRTTPSWTVRSAQGFVEALLGSGKVEDGLGK